MLKIVIKKKKTLFFWLSPLQQHFRKPYPVFQQVQIHPNSLKKALWILHELLNVWMDEFLDGEWATVMLCQGHFCCHVLPRLPLLWWHSLCMPSQSLLLPCRESTAQVTMLSLTPDTDCSNVTCCFLVLSPWHKKSYFAEGEKCLSPTTNWACCDFLLFLRF